MTLPLARDADLHFETMREEDLPAVLPLVDQAFENGLRMLYGSVPPGPSEGQRVKERFYRDPSLAGLVARDSSGVIRAAVFLQRAGAYVRCGPIGVDHTASMAHVGPRLIDFLTRTVEELDGVDLAEGVTFTIKPLHVAMYAQRGFDVGPLIAIMSKRIAKASPSSPPDDAGGLQAYGLSGATIEAREACERRFDEICDAHLVGLRVGLEVRHVLERGLGEVLVARDGGGRIQGFAIMHHSENSERFDDRELLLKQLYVDPSFAHPDQILRVLVSGAEAIGRAAGMTSVLACVFAHHTECMRAMMRHGFRSRDLFVHLWKSCSERRVQLWDRAGHYALEEMR